VTTETIESAQAAPEAPQAPDAGNDELADGLAILDELEGKSPPATQEPDASQDAGAAPADGEVVKDEDEEAAITARAERIAEEKLAEERKQLDAQRAEDAEKTRQENERVAKEQRYRTAAPTLRASLEADGIPEDRINQYLGWFGGFNGDVYSATAQSIRADLDKFASQFLPETDRADFAKANHADTKSLLEDFKARTVADARKGYVSESKAREDAALAVLKAKKRWAQNPDQITSQADGQAARFGATGTGKLYSQLSATERNNLTPEQRDAAVARERQARGV
jgi:hypothetical protein